MEAEGGACVNHYMKLAGGIRKLIVSARITNKQTLESIQVPIHVDAICGVADLVLLPEDIRALNLSCEPTRSMGMQVDGSTVSLARYIHVWLDLR